MRSLLFSAGIPTKAALAGALVVLGATAASADPGAQQQRVAPDAISGVVGSKAGPEAGVWVIAESRDLPTRMMKIVVTDDQGRFLLPQLPVAKYKVWARGYGMADVPAVMSAPGQRVDLTATPAASPAAAAQTYPANYWYSVLKPPAEADFPGTGATGNKIGPAQVTQADFIQNIKEGCLICHQLGTIGTRTIPHAFDNLPTSHAKWDRRVQSGQYGSWMSRNMSGLGRAYALDMFASWTDRIAAGELPAEAPPRPAGIERNAVLTSWDWGDDKTVMHDSVASDERHPTVNANGRVWGLNEYHDYLTWIDPNTSTTGAIPYPTRDKPNPEEWFGKAGRNPLQPSAYWGNERIFFSPANPVGSEMDSKGRVWATSTIRLGESPSWCSDGSIPSSKFFPLKIAGSTGFPQLSYYDPKTGKFSFVETCISPDHFRFMEDPDDTMVSTVLARSGANRLLWWFNTGEFDRTHDERKAIGWCPLVMDTNGDGKVGKWTNPGEPFDPTLDRRYDGAQYHLSIDNAHRTVWLNYFGSKPGALVRVRLGSMKPDSCLTEVFQIPDPHVFGPRGPDVDPANGIVWVPFTGSGHLGRFDPSKCPEVRGKDLLNFQSCKAGWTIYKLPGPNFKGVQNGGSTEWPYLAKVDVHNIMGLGTNTVILPGTMSDSVLIFLPDSEKFLVLRMPFPNGFYSRILSWRIDDPAAGWKGRGLWTNTGNMTLWHEETGKGTLGTTVKFQLRPNPLAD